MTKTSKAVSRLSSIIEASSLVARNAELESQREQLEEKISELEESVGRLAELNLGLQQEIYEERLPRKPYVLFLVDGAGCQVSLSPFLMNV